MTGETVKNAGVVVVGTGAIWKRTVGALELRQLCLRLDVDKLWVEKDFGSAVREKHVSGDTIDGFCHNPNAARSVNLELWTGVRVTKVGEYWSVESHL